MSASDLSQQVSNGTSVISPRDAEMDLSVVVAVWPDLNGAEECLRSLTSQQENAIEILLAGGETFPTEMRARFPSVRWLEGSPKMLVPHLWSLGITASRGKIVALSTSRFVPPPDWLENIFEAHQRLASPGIGGAIEPSRTFNMTGWAIYFLRYSAYLNYTREQIVDEIAGENASYKRESLTAHRAAFAHGFWEPEFHRLLKAEGRTLCFVPAIRVAQGAPIGIGWFCRQRFQHGRRFGQSRIRGVSALIRLARICTAPLVPVVLLVKIFGRVIKSRRYFAQLLFSLPLLVPFTAAWALGEAVGYCTTDRGELSIHDWQRSLE